MSCLDCTGRPVKVGHVVQVLGEHVINAYKVKRIEDGRLYMDSLPAGFISISRRPENVRKLQLEELI